MKYSFDSSSLINPWTKLYPKDVFPGIWERLLDAIEGGTVVAHPTVIVEITGEEEDEEAEDDEGEEDELVSWVSKCGKLEFPTDESVERSAREIQDEYPKLVRATAKVGADPFVIALALQHQLTVVSEESLNVKRAKLEGQIPFVCNRYQVNHINFLQFMREMNWEFK